MPTPTISIDDVKRCIDSKQPFHLIDVRTPGEYERVHARGAKLLPLDALSPATASAERGDGTTPLYVLCHSGGRAAKAVDQLSAAGMLNVYRVEGGTTAWQQAGLPVETSAGGTISIERQVRIGAGSLVLISIALAWLIHPAFIALAAFVGAGLVFAGMTDFCGMGMVLMKMPWNRRGG